MGPRRRSRPVRVLSGPRYRAADFLAEPAPDGYRLGLHAFAKINLGLAVGPRRPDGFHEIRTVCQTIDFADTLYARPRARGFSLRVLRRGPARGRGLAIGRPADNLVLRAARLAGEALGVREGADLVLVKRVPAGSGLGGGSSDAAAALRLVARLWRRRLPPARRRELAAQLGSDCAFFVEGGRALATGRGERLRKRSVKTHAKLVVLLPKRGISTAAAYRLWDESKHLTLRKSASTLSPPRAPSVREGCARSLMPNELEEVIRRHYPDVDGAISRLVQQGVPTTQMSGSGSAVFGLLPAGVDVTDWLQRFPASPFAIVASRFTTGGSRWHR